MQRVRQILSPLTMRNYRLLWIAQVLSEVGDWAARLALAVLVLERTGSATLTGLAIGASLVAWLGPGQLIASMVDHFGRRSVMVASDLIRGTAFLLMLAPVSTVWVIVLAAIAGLAAPSFDGSRSAAQVEVVPEDRYGPALALSGITQDLALLGGYLLGGLALAVTSPTVALGVNAATFFISALVLSFLPRLASRSAENKDKKSGLRPAVAFLLGDAPVRRAATLTVLATFSASAVETLVVVYSVQDVQGPDWLPGALLAAVTTVTLLVTLRIPLGGSPLQLLRVSAWLCLVPSVVIVALSLTSIWTTGAAFLVAGVLFVVTIPTNMVAGPRFPQHLRAVAMSVIIGVIVGGQAIAATSAGLLADLVGTQGAVALAAVPALVGGAYFLLRPALTQEELSTTTQEATA